MVIRHIGKRSAHLKKLGQKKRFSSLFVFFFSSQYIPYEILMFCVQGFYGKDSAHKAMSIVRHTPYFAGDP